MEIIRENKNLQENLQKLKNMGCLNTAFLVMSLQYFDLIRENASG